MVTAGPWAPHEQISPTPPAPRWPSCGSRGRVDLCLWAAASWRWWPWHLERSVCCGGARRPFDARAKAFLGIGDAIGAMLWARSCDVTLRCQPTT